MAAAESVALGIDIGTGSTKAGLVSAGGRLLAVGRAAHPIEEPEPGRSETDPNRWLASVRAAVAEVMVLRPNDRVVAVGLSGQMHGVVACDGSLMPLRNAVLWSDRRAEPYLPALRAELDEALGGAVATHLANPIVTGMAGPTAAAIVREEPATAGAIATLLQPKDWIRHRLTGEVATDPSDASATLLWDAVGDRWSVEACGVFGVALDWLPEVHPSGGAGGTVTADAAEWLGIDAGTPVAIGAADTAAALLGAGVAVGETQVSTGTGGQVAQLTDSLLADRSGRTHIFRAAHVAADATPRWYAMAAMQNVGIAIDWAMSLLGAGSEEIAAAMADYQRPAEGSPVFRPYLTGERTPHMDAALTGSWHGLRPTTTRAELIRSVFVGVAAAMADGKAALVDAGYHIDRALLAGGGSTEAWWQELLATSLVIPLTPHDAVDASVRGAGLLGWASAGHVIDPGKAVTRGHPIEPSLRG